MNLPPLCQNTPRPYVCRLSLLDTLKGFIGKRRGFLFGLDTQSTVSKVTTEKEKDPQTPLFKGVLEPLSSVTRMDREPRKTGVSRPAPEGGSSVSCFPSGSLENPLDSSLERDDSEVPVERF